MQQNLLLLHAALGSKKQLAPLKALLAPHFNCYDLNFEGHGGRFSENDFSITRFTQNVHDYLDEIEVDQISIFGYSMGGFVALNLALNHPNRVSKIITLGTKFDWNPTATAKEVGYLNPAKIKEKIPLYAEKLALEHAPLNWEVVMEKTAQMMLNLAANKDVDTNRFSQIKHPITIGIGSEDRMVSIIESENMAAIIPNAKMELLEGVEHPIDQIDPQILSDYILKNMQDN